MSRAYSPMVVWWGTPVEGVTALARLAREGAMNATGARQAVARLEALRRTWVEVLPTDALRGLAEALPMKHALRTGDVFQPAAALSWCREQPRERPFVSLDHHLAEAARQIGFDVAGARSATD